MTASKLSDHVAAADLSLDNGNVHRAAAKIIVSKSRAARGSVCYVLLSDSLSWLGDFEIAANNFAELLHCLLAPCTFAFKLDHVAEGSQSKCNNLFAF